MNYKDTRVRKIIASISVLKDGDLFGITYIKSNDEDMGTAGLEIFEIIDATPFINAGLNVDGLDSKVISYDSLTNTLVIKKH